VLAIPPKRAEKRTVTFLTPAEVDALLDGPDRATWAGRRDHALLLTAVQTGLRVSELLALTHADVYLGTGPHVRAIGKGRKERVAPLTRQNVAVLRVWMRESRDQPDLCPLFPSRHGGPLTRDGTERRLAKHVATAQRGCPAQRSKRLHARAAPHRRDGAAERRGRHVHDRPLAGPRARTHHPNLPARRPCAQTPHARPHPTPNGHPGRYRAPDTLLAFLEAL
jgi:integrase